MLSAELVMQHKEVVFKHFLVEEDGFRWRETFVFGRNGEDDQEILERLSARSFIADRLKLSSMDDWKERSGVVQTKA
jgi:hypothetical protein